MLKRTVAVLLTLLSAIMLLPKAALAYAVTPDPNPAGSKISIEYTDGTLRENYGTVSVNRGTIGVNRAGGVIAQNNARGTVSYNYGTVNNKGRLVRYQIMDYGTVTNNHGVVYNAGNVEQNGDASGTNPGTVYNDHGRVDYNNANSTVHNYGGLVFGNTGLVNNYGDSGAVITDPNVKVYQYWKVTTAGASAANVTVGGLTEIFGGRWVSENSFVTLTPESGYCFTLAPTATKGTVLAEGNVYKITDIDGDTVITVDGVTAVTDVDFLDLSADGSDTESTSLLTLSFDADVSGLSADDVTVIGASKGALTKAAAGTGVYTLAVSGLAVADNGSVSVAVQKQGFEFSPVSMSVQVRNPGVPATTSVTVSPSAAGVVKGGMRQFSATVNNAGDPVQAVTWSIAGNASSETGIDATGLLTVGTDETAAILYITAALTADAGRSGTAIVTVKDPRQGEAVPAVSISGASVFSQGAASALRLIIGSEIAGFNATYNLSSVTVNGSTLTEGAEYTAMNGSIIIDFDQGWLNSLTPGDYSVIVYLKGGSYAPVRTGFTVAAPGTLPGDAEADVPKTGDGAPVALLTGLIPICGAGLVMRARKRKIAVQARQ